MDRPPRGAPRTSSRAPLDALTRWLTQTHGQAVIGIYRIAVLGHSTPSFASAALPSQNSGLSKAGFYVFHVAPEFLAAAILAALNVRRMFSTGMWGDTRGTDPPEPEPEAEQEREQEQKKDEPEPELGDREATP